MTRLATWLIVLSFLIVSAARAQVLTWPPVTTNADAAHTPITDLAGYKLYCGNASGAYDAPIVLGGGVNTYTLPAGVTDQVRYCALTAFDTATPQNESGKSNEVSKLILAKLPGAFPLQFTDTVPETLTASLILTIPIGATAASFAINCFDCDHPDWGTLSVNGNATIPVWPGSSGANSNANGIITVPVPIASIKTGTNLISIIHTGAYGGSRVDGIAVTYTVPVVIPPVVVPPVNPPPAPPTLTISRLNDKQVLITALPGKCKNIITSAVGSTKTNPQQTVTCIP